MTNGSVDEQGLEDSRQAMMAESMQFSGGKDSDGWLFNFNEIEGDTLAGADFELSRFTLRFISKTSESSFNNYFQDKAHKSQPIGLGIVSAVNLIITILALIAPDDNFSNTGALVWIGYNFF